jgi:predicted transcriptional regulator
VLGELRLQLKRSKLEVNMDILEVLAFKGQYLKLTHIMYKSNVNCSILKEQMEFLIKNCLVEERRLRKEQIVYGITPRGMQVLKSFREIKQVFPEEEEKKNPFLF